MTEAYLDLDDLAKYYGTNFTEHAGDISHLPLNLDFVNELRKRVSSCPFQTHSNLLNVFSFPRI